MKLSIVILAYNKWNFTKSCLNDLTQLPLDHEIILVDNNSSDLTQQEIVHFPRVKYIRNDTNLGFSKGTGIGYSNSTADVVMFLNNDIRIKQDHTTWTTPILNAVDIQPNTLFGPTGGYLNPKNNYGFCYETDDPNKAINYMSGWCLTAHKNTWNQLIEKNDKGPFPEDMFFYHDDSWVGFKATKLNIKFQLISVPIVHFKKISSQPAEIPYHYNNSKKIFLEKVKKELPHIKLI